MKSNDYYLDINSHIRNIIKTQDLNKEIKERLLDIIEVHNLFFKTMNNITTCLNGFDISKATYYRYMKKIKEKSSFSLASKRPENIKYQYDWDKIENYIKYMINRKSKNKTFHITKATILMRINKHFKIKLSFTTFYKKIDLERYRRKKKIKVLHKRWEVSKPGYIQIDGVNLNEPTFALKNSRHHIFTAIDCYSRVSFAYCYDEKSRHNAIDFSNRAIKYFSDQHIKVDHIRTDNGSEFVYTKSRKIQNKKHRILSQFELNLFYNDINHDTIIPGFPNQNGKVERFNNSLIKEHVIYSYENYDNMHINAINNNLKIYLRHYNNERYHGTLKTTPNKVLKDYTLFGVISNHIFV